MGKSNLGNYFWPLSVLLVGKRHGGRFPGPNSSRLEGVARGGGGAEWLNQNKANVTLWVRKPSRVTFLFPI